MKEIGILEAQAAMDAGQISSHELVMYYLERMAAIDKSGPQLTSIAELNPDALFIADKLDGERKSNGSRGPMHGIPVLIKDNIDTADKMHTSAGSLALANSYARADAFLVTRLRSAGAIILGKTNLTEWANIMTKGMPNGYSSRGGQVLNPYSPGKFDAGGSSSGSAVAVAADLAAVAVGTETSGSILSPASANSIVGIKPTVGLISRRGVIPISHSQDTPGPMARTVTDAAILLGALTGGDEHDPATWHSVARSPNDYVQCLDAAGLKRARLGVCRQYYKGLDEAGQKVMESALDLLRELGAELIDPVEIASFDEPFDINVLLYELKPNLNAYLSGLRTGVPVHSLKEVIVFNAHDPALRMKFGQTLLIASEATRGTLTEPEYINSRSRDIRLSQKDGIDKAMREHTLDALVFPNNFGAAIAAKAGYPSITVPAGYTSEGKPLGLTLTARAYEEPTLIRLAYSFEQGTLLRKPPCLA